MPSKNNIKRLQTKKLADEEGGLIHCLVDSTGAVPWEFDLATKCFTYVGPQIVEMLGYPVDEWCQEKFWARHMHPDDRDWAIEFCHEATLRNEDHDFEYRMITADGCVVWIRDSVLIVRDESGPVALRGYMFNITAQRQAIEALTRSKAEFEAMFNAIPDAVVFADTERRIVMNNPAVHKMFGYTDKELIGQTTEMLYADKQDFKDQGRRRYRAGAGAETAPYEVRYKRKDGTVFWSETLGTQVKDTNGTVIGFIGMFRDITERKRAEEKLRLQAAAIESAANGIVITNHDGEIQWVNPAFTRSTGYGFEEAVGQNPRLLKSGNQDQEFYQKLWDTILAGRVWHGELINRRKDGSLYTDEQSITPVYDEQGKITHFVAIKQDITERKQVEQVLRDKEARIRMVIESALDAIIVIDAKSIISEWNPQAETIFGWKSSEVIGRTLMETIIPERYRQAHQQGVKTLLATGEGPILNKRIEMTALNREGKEFPVELTVAPLQTGETWTFSAFVRDLTKPQQVEAERKQTEEALRNSERELSAILNTMQDTYYRTDMNGLLSHVSASVQQLLGFSPKELLGTKLADLYVDPQGREKFILALKEADGKLQNYEAQLRHKDGSAIWVSTNAQYIRDEQGAIIGVEGTTRDVSQIKSAEDLSSRFGRILDNSSNEIYIFDTETMHFTLVNKGARLNLGYTMQEMEQLTPVDLKPDYTKEIFEELLQPLLKGEQEQVVFQTRHLRKNGSLYPVEVNLQISRQESPPIFVAIIQDITARIQTEERLQFLAHHDALTALPNRVLFTDRLDQSIARAHRHNRAVAVLFLDLDRFKLINDTLGHDFGDRALQALAERLSDCARDGDTVARFGGDEFAIVLEDIASADDVAPTARKILDSLAQSFMLDEHEFFITTSIGISLFPIDGRDTQTLLKHADIAMYRAKDLGRNTYQFYSSDMSAKNFERLSLETSLRHALEREEFVLHYQPQLDLRSGKVTGVEALIRWQHPDLGLIKPLDFIPLLEDTGLIVPVGEWVLRTACSEVQAWNKTDLKPIRVAVNLSSRQFNDPNFTEMVARILKETGLKSSLLELEITETVLMQNVAATVETMKVLNEIGIRFSIDDFGTGYSSLSYLKRFPIDTLKIDQTFIHDMIEDPEDAILVEAIIALGRALHLNIIAEGVETEAHIKFLKRCNCDCIQGYVFETPLPAQELLKRLRKKKSDKN